MQVKLWVNETAYRRDVMTDFDDSETRSRMMAGIRSKGTRPETLVRSLLHMRGLRFARTSSGLPGRPDVVLPRWRVAVFVNGCFWHMHECRLFRMPGSNREFWERKLYANRMRDVKKHPGTLGWRMESPDNMGVFCTRCRFHEAA
jgi:DNA mismatch endonuclease (patch repair protein)